MKIPNIQEPNSREAETPKNTRTQEHRRTEKLKNGSTLSPKEITEELFEQSFGNLQYL